MNSTRSQSATSTLQLQALQKIADASQRWQKESLPHFSQSAGLSYDATYEKRRKRTPEYIESVLTTKLLRVAVREIAAALHLERCAIVFPDRARDNFWTLAASIGVPPEIAGKSFYSKGEGLTGKVLLGQTQRSGDILNDDNQSKRYGSTWILADGTPDASNTPRSYLGMPLWMQQSDKRQDYVGAIYGIRPRERFTPDDEHFMKLASQLISFGRDRLRSWRKRAESDIRQLKMSRLWQYPLSDTHKYQEALSMLREEFPFPRLLLSLVDIHKLRVLGVASVGFRPDILIETNRPIPSVGAEDDRTCEDILAMIHRIRSPLPRVISPNDKEWQKVEAITAFRHQVKNPLLLVPMISSTGDVMGILLAELPAASLSLSAHEMERLSTFANHLASLIESHRTSDHLLSHKSAWASIHTTIFSRVGGSVLAPLEDDIGPLLQQITTFCGIPAAILYALDECDQMLRPVAGVGVPNDTLRQRYIDLRRVSTLDQYIPIAAEAALRGLPICRPVTAEIYYAVSLDPSVTLGIDRSLNSCIAATPTFDRHGCNGVLVYSERPLGDVCRKCEEISQFLPALGHMLAVMRIKEQGARSGSVSSAFQSLSFAIGELGRFHPSDNTRFPDEIACTSVLRDIAVMFDTSLSQLYLFEEPVVIPSRALQNVISLVYGHTLKEVARYVENDLPVRFQGRIINVPSVKRDITIDANLGLTQSVIKGMRTVVTGDVENDHFWSQRDLNGNSDRVPGSAGCRAFLGTPLFVDTERGRMLYGALTFTRLRSDVSDSRDFKYEEIQSAQNISNLISSSLDRRREVRTASEVQERVRRCLRWFRHDIPGMMTDIQVKLARCVDTLGNGNAQSAEVADLADATRSVFLACALGLEKDPVTIKKLRGYSEYEGTVDALFSSIQQRVVLLLESDLHRGDTMIDFVCRSGHSLIGDLWATPLMYCCFALVQNAYTACYHNKHNTSSKCPGRVQVEMWTESDSLVLTVQDDGGGLRGQTVERMCEEMHSGWPSEDANEHSGMGLSIVHTISTIHLGGSLSAADVGYSNGRIGAKFRLTVPVSVRYRDGVKTGAHKDVDVGSVGVHHESEADPKAIKESSSVGRRSKKG